MKKCKGFDLCICMCCARCTPTVEEKLVDKVIVDEYDNLYCEHYLSDGCVCQECNKEYTIDLLIEDNLWEQIKPIGKNKGQGLLCGACIMKKLEDIYGFHAFELHQI